MTKMREEADLAQESITILNHRTNECLDLQRCFERQDDNHPHIWLGQRGTSIDDDRFNRYYFGTWRRDVI
jgi:hypothetical protein